MDRVCEAVHGGMGIIFLHSAHFAKPLKRLIGRAFATCPGVKRASGNGCGSPRATTPIAAGLPDHFELENEEMSRRAPWRARTHGDGVYQLVSGRRGVSVWPDLQTGGDVLLHGHETYPTYHDANVQRVILNGVKWAFNPACIANPNDAPNTPVDKALRGSPNAAPVTMTAKRGIAGAAGRMLRQSHGGHGGRPCRVLCGHSGGQRGCRGGHAADQLARLAEFRMALGRWMRPWPGAHLMPSPT